MTLRAKPSSGARSAEPRWPIVTALGVTQIMAWGSSYYLPAVMAGPIAAETGWPRDWIVGGLSLGLLAGGLSSPVIGRAIARRGGRPVLAVSAVLLAAGLIGMGLSHTLPVFLASWLVLGIGMGAGLYDPAFATLGRIYGERGRAAITALTLFGGFASTVCWPLSAFLEAHLGWRGACLAYAAIQLGVSLPIYLFGLPREAQSPVMPAVPALVAASDTRPRAGAIFVLIAATVTLASVISTLFSVHLLTILQGKGLTMAAATGLGALVGPSQVGARAIEMAVARHHHPAWTNMVATALVAAGLLVLWFGGPLLTLAIVLYGAGIGLESIARGTMPLAIFGRERYPAMMGRIALPNLMAQTAAPSAGALLLASVRLDEALLWFMAAAICNAVLAGGLLLQVRRVRTSPATKG